ncbi:MAG: hypothetical protein ACI3ZF_04225 [Candidatus Cryptobacteroides sp.]
MSFHNPTVYLPDFLQEGLGQSVVLAAVDWLLRETESCFAMP